MAPIVAPPAHVQPAFSEFSQLSSPSTAQQTRPESQAPFGWSVHVVRSGDTLSELALQYHTTVRTLVRKNGLDHRAVPLTLGQRVAVPRLRPRPATRSGTERHTSYTVRPGDTLGGVAVAHRTSLRSILQANGLTHTRIRPGQDLVIPGGKDSARRSTKSERSSAARRGTRVVTVRHGETISHLALRHGVSRTAIIKANGLGAGAAIRAGQRLSIPGVALRSEESSASRDPRLSGSAEANRRYLHRSSVPSRSAVRKAIVRTSRQHGVDAKLALAISYQESGWNQRAVSSANAVGVMQCLPSTGRWISQIIDRDLNLLNARDNITCGVVLMRVLGRSTATESEVIAAYYQGLGALRRHGMYGETERYVANVQAHKRRM